jgi:hypothetical protein
MKEKIQAHKARVLRISEVLVLSGVARKLENKFKKGLQDPTP